MLGQNILANFLKLMRKLKYGRIGIIVKENDTYYSYVVSECEIGATINPLRESPKTEVVESWPLNEVFTEARLKKRVDLLNRQARREERERKCEKKP